MSLLDDAYAGLTPDKLPASHRHALARETLDPKDIRLVYDADVDSAHCLLGICGSDPTPGHERQGVYVVLALHRDEHDKPAVTLRGDATEAATAAHRFTHLVSDLGGDAPGLSGTDLEKLVRRQLKDV